MRWFDDESDPTPFLTALEETRRLATREGWHYQHVQAIIVTIDQYAEAPLAIASSFWISRRATRQVIRANHQLEDRQSARSHRAPSLLVRADKVIE
jgi:hypothetical protein